MNSDKIIAIIIIYYIFTIFAIVIAFKKIANTKTKDNTIAAAITTLITPDFFSLILSGGKLLLPAFISIFIQTQEEISIINIITLVVFYGATKAAIAQRRKITRLNNPE